MALTPVDKTAASDEAFLREVDDAVRASDAQHFWKNYGRWLVGAVIIGLAAFAGFLYWQSNKQAAEDAVGERYFQAVEKMQTDEKSALAELSKLEKADQPAYRAMAQIVIANVAAKNGNEKLALAQYGKVIADNSLPQLFRDQALILKTRAEFDTLAPQQVVDRLKPLAKPGAPWFGSAGEMTAVAYQKMGKENLAGPIFAQIAKQKDLSVTLRGRARDMAGSLGIDVVQIDENKDGAKPSADKGQPK